MAGMDFPELLADTIKTIEELQKGHAWQMPSSNVYVFDGNGDAFRALPGPEVLDAARTYLENLLEMQ